MTTIRLSHVQLENLVRVLEAYRKDAGLFSELDEWIEFFSAELYESKRAKVWYEIVRPRLMELYGREE